MSKERQLSRRQATRRSAAAMCTTALLALSGAALAQAKTSARNPAVAGDGADTVKFTLRAEPLAETLLAISLRSGQTVEFNPTELTGIKAPAIIGEYTPVAAIQKAIAGTKATMTDAPGGGWIVFIPTTLHTITVTATRSEAETSFQATRSDTATRSGANLMDVPQSMTIITSAVMETQQALSLQDVLQDVSGVQTQPESQGPPTVSVRGFSQTSLTNGLTDSFATNADVAGVERVEVLRGPQAVLSGSDTLGGVVNVVTKKPTATPLADLTLQYGTFGDKTVTGDLSGALAAEGRLSGRLIASWTRATTSAAGYDGRRSTYLMPQMRWKDDRTDFIFGVSYDDEFDPLPQFTFALNSTISPVPTMRFGNVDNGIEVKTKSVFYSLTHRFAPWLSWVSRFDRDVVDQDTAIWGPFFPLDIPSMTLAFAPTNNTTKYGTTSTDNYLRFSFRTGPVQHVLATGANTTSLDYVESEYYPPNFSFIAVQAYSPQQYDFPYVTRNAASLNSVSFIKDSQYGLYAQDLITYRDLHAVLNVRSSHYQDGPDATVFPGFPTFNTPEQSFSHTTPGAGLVYNVTPDVSAYGQYSEGFAENYASTLCGQGLTPVVPPPQTSENEELGVKASLPNGLFSVTSDIFSLTENNVLQYNAAQACSVLIPGYRTRGVEADAQGQLAKGWNLIANFTDARYTNVGESSILVAGEPRLHFSLWSTYAFQYRPLQGFGVAGGITAYSWSYTNYAPGYANEPGGARVDLSAFYQVRRFSLILGVKNAFNRTLYDVASTPIGVPVEPGRTVMFTAKYHFL